MIMVMVPQLAFAASKVYFINTSSARKVVVSLKYAKSYSEYLEKQNFMLGEQTNNLLQQKNLLVKENEGLVADTELLKTGMESYKKQYTETTDKLNKTIEEQPSRLTWFMSGVITTLVLLVGGTILIK